MKSVLVILAIISTLSIAKGQSKYDPTYSINNYKQPNKAEVAKDLKNEGVESEGYINESNTNASHRNYKVFKHDDSPSGAVVATAPADNNRNALASRGHYKSAFGKSSAKKSSGEENAEDQPVVKK